ELDTMNTTKETGIKYLKIQDIENASINKNLPNLKNVDEKYHNYFLEEGNLVISKSSPYKIARVENHKNTKILATGNLYYIEIDEDKEIGRASCRERVKSSGGRDESERKKRETV